MEYSISEGWIRVAAGRSRDRFGQPMTIKLKGTVEPYFESPPQDEGEETASEDLRRATRFDGGTRGAASPG